MSSLLYAYELEGLRLLSLTIQVFQLLDYLTLTLTSTVAIWTAIKHPLPDRVKPLFVIFDIRAL